VPDFKVTLISVNKFAKSGLSAYFPGDSNTCSIYQGRQPVMTGTHWQNLYHANMTPVIPAESAHATVDINLLHQ
ncbi:hypothetical protein F5J12DRAFT_725121, partial [Pisolithus orientalis]|uniref:uncharacterized protein n=1 Tax=Pisolithus orientalis TaxID=936130 RepID=UPI0022246929